MNAIIVVSLGPGSRDMLTLGALDALRRAERVILRTGRTDAAAYLRKQGVAFDTLDALHESSVDFDAFAAAAADAVAHAAQRQPVAFAVLDACCDAVAALLLSRYPEHVRFVDGASLAAPLLQAAGASLPVRVCAASALRVCGGESPLLIVELGSRMLAGQCKLALAPWFGDDCPALFFPPSDAAARHFLRLPLHEIDRQPAYDHTCAVYLPALPLTQKTRFDAADLAAILSLLCGEGGCPWDREQTHQSLSRYLIEEAYEVSSAVQNAALTGDYAAVADELGDVLLQVVFQSDIGRRFGNFDLSDVSTAICRKMLQRHTHIFGADACDTAEQVAANWERMKRRQRGNTTLASAMRAVDAGLPALLRMEKVLAKAYRAGLSPQNIANFADAHCADTARRMWRAACDALQSGQSAEEAAAYWTNAFIQRFEKAENLAISEGKCMDNLTSAEINVYWTRSE